MGKIYSPYFMEWPHYSQIFYSSLNSQSLNIDYCVQKSVQCISAALFIWCHCSTNKLENKANSQTSESEFCFIFSVQTEKILWSFFTLFLFRLQRNMFYCLTHSAKRFCSFTVAVGILHYVVKNKQMYCTQNECLQFLFFPIQFYVIGILFLLICRHLFCKVPPGI